jgi:hypothetical protein
MLTKAGLLQAIIAPHLLVARLQVAEDRARRRQQQVCVC